MAALPLRAVYPVRKYLSDFPEFKWPYTKTYNGFTGLERARGWQLARWLLYSGCVYHADKCHICGSTYRVQFHSESYYDTTKLGILCGTCHTAIHRRAALWDNWRGIVDRHVVTGREWWAQLERRQVDLAAIERAKYGWGAANLLNSPIFTLPVGVKNNIPKNMIQHPNLILPTLR